jgi:hypothetical protein
MYVVNRRNYKSDCKQLNAGFLDLQATVYMIPKFHVATVCTFLL